MPFDLFRGFNFWFYSFNLKIITYFSIFYILHLDSRNNNNIIMIIKLYVKLNLLLY